LFGHNAPDPRLAADYTGSVFDNRLRQALGA